MSNQSKSVWPAPAKLNLFLHVTGQRPDGYHELQTLFQLLDWGDEVSIEPLDEPRIERPRASYAVQEADDLVVRAALLLQAETSCRQGARIEVKKHIPAGAGLGGGSSDAATVLVVLNRLWGCGLDIDDLASMGIRLGADVPVFVRGYSAFASGLGDELQSVDLGDRYYLLVFPGFSISTGAVFMHPDLPKKTSKISLAEALAGVGRNDCELVVKKQFPHLKQMLKDLQKWGPARMSGTGSTLFISMPDEKTAKSTAQAIKCRYNVRAVRGVDRSPLHELLESGGVGGIKNRF
ncbi:MAG: 4-(cytidine 5'-diphospho)-2-C-methyl-D-erythritol kinase [Proteobacteria bacterium]|nr:4-(cytidine 5'-diphospho)-2-C-methyl-D-erythritol kinase [Pseudomonadota bacterium]